MMCVHQGQQEADDLRAGKRMQRVLSSSDCTLQTWTVSATASVQVQWPESQQEAERHLWSQRPTPAPKGVGGMLGWMNGSGNTLCREAEPMRRGDDDARCGQGLRLWFKSIWNQFEHFTSIPRCFQYVEIWWWGPGSVEIPRLVSFWYPFLHCDAGPDEGGA